MSELADLCGKRVGEGRIEKIRREKGAGKERALAGFTEGCRGLFTLISAWLHSSRAWMENDVVLSGYSIRMNNKGTLIPLSRSATCVQFGVRLWVYCPDEPSAYARRAR